MMLQRKVPVWMLIAAVVGVLLLVGLGSAIRSDGWNEGFTIGLLAGGGAGEGGAVVPFLSERYGGGLPHGGFFGFIGGVFHFFFLLLFVGIILKFLGFLRWQAHRRGPWHHQGKHRWHSEENESPML